MKKKIAIVMTALCMMSTSSLAAEIKNCDISVDGVVTFENSLDSNKEGAMVSLMVLQLGVSADDLLENVENISKVAAGDRTVSGKDGAYTFSFEIDGQSEFYDCIVGSDAGDEQNFQILYSNPDEAKELILKLNNASDEEEFYNLIFGEDEGYKALAFFLSLPEEANTRKVSDMMYDYVNTESELDENNIKTTADTYKKFYVIELLNEEKEISVSDFEKYLDVKSFDFFKYYEKDFITESVKEEIYHGLLGESFKTEEELEKAFLEQLILKTVRYGGGFGDVRDILQDNEAYTGIDTDKLKRENYVEVLGKSYADYDDLEEGLTKKTTQNSGSSGSSSGSGSKSEPKPIGGNSGVAINSDGKNSQKTNPIYFEDGTTEIFSDIQNVPWAKDAIEDLSKAGIVSGKGDNLFCPDDNITREEFAAIIVRAMNIEDKTANVSFSDVKDEHWFASYINAAVAEGIILGKDDGSFGVGENITRQDMAVMINRALKLQDEGLKTEAFKDDADISEYAKAAVYNMQNKSIILGFEDESFRPKSFATRAQAAVVIYRAFFD